MSRSPERPPRLSTALLRRILPSGGRRDCILGDFHEEFLRRSREDSGRSASVWYRREAVSVAAYALRRRLGFAAVRPRSTTTTANTTRSEEVWTSILQDLTTTARNLRRSPGFSLIAIFSLAIGIAGSTLIFGFVNALFFRPPAGVRDPSELIVIYTNHPGRPFGSSAYPDVEDIREQVSALNGVTAFDTDEELRLDEGSSVSLFGMEVDSDYFRTLGIALSLGRGFTSEESAPKPSESVVIVSHEAWQDYFGGTTDILGRSVRINGLLRVVIGVAPAGLSVPGLPITPMVYLPLHGDWMGQRGTSFLRVMGRLAAGADIELARQQLQALGTRLRHEYPESWLDQRGNSRSFGAESEAEGRIPPGDRSQMAVLLSILMTVLLTILAVACTNLANLLLARLSRREGEIALRRALGGSALRLTSLLMLESWILASIAGALALTCVIWINGAIAGGTLLAGLPARLHLTVDWRVLGFAVTTAFLTGLFLGALPSWRAVRNDPLPAIRGMRGIRSSMGNIRMRRMLIVVQTAVSLILVVSAALLVRSVRVADAADLGFEPDQVVGLSVNLDSREYSADEASLLVRDLDRRLSELPSKTAMALVLPLSGRISEEAVTISSLGADSDIPVQNNLVTPGYFEVMGMRLARGRTFRPGDASKPVAIVNEAFVGRYLDSPSALSATLRVRDQERRIVGVVKDAKYASISEPPTPRFWLPLGDRRLGELALISRTDGSPQTALRTLADVVGDADPYLPIQQPALLSDLARSSILPLRVASGVLGASGVLALVLVVIGIYGVVGYAVHQRMGEIGVRMALGSEPSRVISLVLRDSLRLTSYGLVIGLLGVIAVTRLIASMLIGIDPLDLPSLAIGLVLLLSASAGASLLPAWKAGRIDPVQALRSE